MQKITTNNQQSIDSSKKKPKESTVAFIKQFARVCKIKKMVQPELGLFVLN